MKNFDKKDIFTCVNAEDADQYRSTKGYFADDLSELNEKVKDGNLEKLHHILQDIFPNRFFGNNRAFALFLPADKVKKVKEEKKYRPFKSFNEFNVVTNKNVGDLINYKLKNSPCFYCAVITKTFCSPNIEPTIDFGNSCFKYSELFNHFEWLDSENTWKPFGVEE